MMNAELFIVGNGPRAVPFFILKTLKGAHFMRAISAPSGHAYNARPTPI